MQVAITITILVTMALLVISIRMINFFESSAVIEFLKTRQIEKTKRKELKYKYLAAKHEFKRWLKQDVPL